VRSGQDSDNDEAANEEQVQDDKQPAEEFGSAALEAEVDNQRGDGVGRCSCKDALDCTGGVAHIADHSVNLVETRGEETEGADSVVSNRVGHRMHFGLT
jgi:hypothetical protein